MPPTKTNEKIRMNEDDLSTTFDSMAIIDNTTNTNNENTNNACFLVNAFLSSFIPDLILIICPKSPQIQAYTVVIE